MACIFNLCVSLRFPCIFSVAEPLVDAVSVSDSGKSLPPGCMWMGHLYVQDMCNLQCVASPVSGPPESMSLVCQHVVLFVIFCPLYCTVVLKYLLYFL